MGQTALSAAERACEHVERALEALRAGKGVLVADDEDRENEGDMIFAAETLTNEQMALMIREGTGIVCLCLPCDKVAALKLPMMVDGHTVKKTAFTVSVDAAHGITTGVSAADRVATVKAAIADNAKPEDLARPGHMFPLRACSGGVLDRPGHTEATVDLMRLAGLKPYGVLCELINPDGTMARFMEIKAFAQKQGMPVVTIGELVAYRRDHKNG